MPRFTSKESGFAVLRDPVAAIRRDATNNSSPRSPSAASICASKSSRYRLSLADSTRISSHLRRRHVLDGSNPDRSDAPTGNEINGARKTTLQRDADSPGSALACSIFRRFQRPFCNSSAAPRVLDLVREKRKLAASGTNGQSLLVIADFLWRLDGALSSGRVPKSI